MLVRIPLGLQIIQKPPTNNVERFLAMIRFNSKEKLEITPIFKCVPVSDFENLIRDRILFIRIWISFGQPCSNSYQTVMIFNQSHLLRSS